LKRTGALLFPGEENRWSTVVKRTGTLLFSGEGNRWSTVVKRTGTLLFSGEGNRWSTASKRTSAKCSAAVLRRRKLLFYCFEKNWCSTAVLWRRKLALSYFWRMFTTVLRIIKVQCSSILKRIGAQLFPGEENRCSDSFKRKE